MLWFEDANVAVNGEPGTNESAISGVPYLTSLHPVSELESLFNEIRRSRFTGTIHLHYSQGAPSGFIEVKRRVPLDVSVRSVASTISNGYKIST